MQRFAEYAAAFEEAIRSDNWSGVAPFFAEDACYTTELPPPLGGRFEGRVAILAYFKHILDAFDRRFATRESLPGGGSHEDGNTLSFHGRVRWTAPGRPDLIFAAEEQVTFRGEVIVDLVDRYDAESVATIAAYLREHGPALGIGW
jgi:ketosteroid isomerase-like protein